MYCSKCGNEMLDGDKFCTSCGKKADPIPEKEDYSEYARPEAEPADYVREEPSANNFTAPLIGGGLGELYEEIEQTNQPDGEIGSAQPESGNPPREPKKKRAAKRIACLAAALIFAAGCSAVTYRYAWAAGAESMEITSGELNRANKNATTVRNFVNTYIGNRVNNGEKRSDIQAEILGEYSCTEMGSSDFSQQLRKELQSEGIDSGTIIISTAYIGGMDMLFVQWQQDGGKNDVKAIGQYPDPIDFESRYAVIFGEYKQAN